MHEQKVLHCPLLRVNGLIFLTQSTGHLQRSPCFSSSANIVHNTIKE